MAAPYPSQSPKKGGWGGSGRGNNLCVISSGALANGPPYRELRPGTGGHPRGAVSHNTMQPEPDKGVATPHGPRHSGAAI